MYCGIDVAKNKSQICIMDDNRTVTAEFEIEHNAEGFTQLEKHLTKETKIGMEPTSNYCKALYFYLKDKYDVAYIDTGQMRSFANLHSFKVKNDRVDAKLIALYMAYNFKTVTTIRTDELKDLARLYHKTLKHLVRQKFMFLNQLNVIFPELEQNFHLKRTKGMANLLLQYPSPQEIARLPAEEILRLLTKDLQRGKIFTLKRAQLLKEIAENSVGIKNYPTSCLKHTIRAMLHFQELVDQVKKDMGKCLAKTPYHPLLKQYCYSTTSVSVIVAEVGDIRRFPTYKKFVKYCGFGVSEKQSGNTKSVNCFITKRGNRYLRSVFYELALVHIAHKTHIADFYYRIKKNGKHGKTCQVAAARKVAIRAYFDMLKCHETQKINSGDTSNNAVNLVSMPEQICQDANTLLTTSSEPKSP